MARTQRSSPIQRLAQLVIVIALPAFLLLSNVRLLMTPAFLHYEYSRPDFPAAPGLNPTERLAIAQTTLDYVQGQADLETLRRLPYREKEVQHLVDVRVVTGQAFAVHWLAGGLLLGALLFLVRRPGTRLLAARGLLYGSALTLVLLVALALFIYANFDVFFVKFHQMFFAGDSWLFAYEDTLIRLFPVPFWFAAALGLALLTIGEALVIGLGAYVWWRRSADLQTCQVLGDLTGLEDRGKA
jgi:integral membrane protein (TIGR01906 family)